MDPTAAEPTVTQPFKAKCSRCGKVFESDKSQNGANQAVRMHVARSHDHTINPNARWKSLKAAEQRLKDMKAKNHGGDLPKRQYIKRNPPVTGTVTINFCPKCGTDLHKIATAVVLAGKFGQ